MTAWISRRKTMLDKAPSKKLSDLLDQFGGALAANDIEKAVGCSGRTATGATSSPSPGTSRRWKASDRSATCWRRRSPTRSRRTWRSDGETRPRADGVTEGWFTFETATARGKGHHAPQGRPCWTLLTTMEELKGYEEKEGSRAPIGAEHGVRQEPQDVARAQEPRGSAELGIKRAALLRDHRRRPGRHRARRPAQAARRADDHHREERAAGRHLAQALQVALPARPGLVRPHALPAVSRTTGRSSRRRTRSATGWRCTPR